MAIQQTWNIRSRANACACTGRPFAAGEEIITVIVPDAESGDFVRKDYSAEAWDEVRESLDPPPFSFWKSEYEPPPPPDTRPDVVGKESAEALLRRLIDENEPHTENARYILAVMLERRKTLRQVDTQLTDSSRLLVYENPKSGEVVIIRDPELKLSEADAVQAEVAALLAGNERAPGGPAPTEAAQPDEPGESEAADPAAK